MKPYYADDSVTLYHDDCLDVLREMPDASVDAVVTDPPYGLGFMGKEWDTASILHRPPSADSPTAVKKYPETGRGPGAVTFDGRAFQQWCEQWATECLRVLKPGGHMLAFGGTRTWHRLACAVEDAGFEVRDSIAWLYGSGFPKSLDVSKAITATQTVGSSSRRANRQAMTGDDSRSSSYGSAGTETSMLTARSTPPPVANLTPAAERWQGWGTALKPAFEPIVVARKPLAGTVAGNVLAHGTGALNVDACRVESDGSHMRPFQPSNAGRDVYGTQTGFQPTNAAGRWPANVLLDGSQADALGSESRFFPTFRYEAKAPTLERPRDGATAHPTVKPLDLMRWLVRLVTPPGGTVLEPFAGSGTTAEACVLEGFQCIAIEREADYLPLIMQRLSKPLQAGLSLDFGEGA